MKTISATVLVALFAASNARFLDAVNTVAVPATAYGVATFASTLNCGQCIGLGHNYCINKAEHTLTNAYPATTNNAQICIANGASSVQQTDGTYSCSNTFADRVYAKYTCQFNTAACGASDTVTLAAVNATQNVTVTNLAQGQTCFYNVKAACGAPAFLPDPFNNTKFEFEYVHYQDGNLNSTDPVTIYGGSGINPNATAKRQSAPATTVPRRDHYFRSELGGNQVSNANITAYVSDALNGTVWGVSGRYDKVAGGRKVYGNPTQGALQLGNLTNLTNADCTPRSLHLAVTAITADTPSTNVTFSSVAFYRPPTVTVEPSGASFLSMTAAAVLGLVSLAFF